MNESIERTWQALVAVDQWFHNDFTAVLEQSAAVEPSQWRVIHEAARVLNEEQLAIPAELYRLGMDALKNSLEPNVNRLLDLMRELLQARLNDDAAAAAALLEEINAQVQVIVYGYRAKLLVVKAVLEGDETVLLQPDSMQRVSLVSLRQLLARHFDDAELRLLCFDLGVDYDDLPAAGKTNKAMELVALLSRRSAIDQLLEVGQKSRPDVPWSDVMIV